MKVLLAVLSLSLAGSCTAAATGDRAAEGKKARPVMQLMEAATCLAVGH
jgi:hypothetical protein